MKLIALFCIFIGLVGCSSIAKNRDVQSVADVSRSDQDQAFLEAQLYLFAGQPKKAGSILKDALSLNPPETATLEYEKMLTRIEAEAGQAEDAFKRISRLVENFPENKSVLKEAAQFFYEIRMKDKAYELYTKLTNLSPENSNFWIYRGLLALELADIKSAWDSFDFLINKSGDAEYLGHLYMGKLMQMTNFSNKAESSFKSCLNVKPKAKECALELAEQKYRQGERKLAVGILDSFLNKIKLKESGLILKKLSNWSIQNKDYEKATYYTQRLERVNPSDVDLKRKAALLFVEQGRYREAKERMKIIVNHSNSKEQDVLNYLNILNLLNQSVEAHAFLKSAVKTHVLNEHAFLKKFKFDEVEQGSEAAQKTLKSSCKLNKSNEASCLYVYSFVLLKNGQPVKARKNLERFLRTKPDGDLTRAQYFLGQIYSQEGDGEKSINIMDEILESDPVYAPALNFKAYALIKEKSRILEAERLSLRALAVQPKNGHYLDTYGWILHKKGSHKEALAVLTQAFQLKSDEPEILEHIADVYMALKDKVSAVRFYKLASQLLKGQNQSRVGKKIVQAEDIKRSISSTPDHP